ncbi:hypothetical protein ES705_34899 [subsurface metagenome]
MHKTLEKNSLKKTRVLRTKSGGEKTIKKRTEKARPRKKVSKSRTKPLSEKNTAVKKVIPPLMQVVGFNIGSEYFGVDIYSVEEVIQMVEITEMPRSPEFVEGIIDIRGKIVPLINLRRMMGLEQKEHNLNNEIIITKVENKEIGLIVDNVSEISTVQREQIIEPDKETVPLATFLFGVADSGGRLMFLLDLVKVLHIEQRALLKKISRVRQIIERPVEEKNNEKEILHQRAVDLRKKKIEDNVEKRRLVTFSIGDEWYGVDINRVKEISHLLDIFYIPSAPHHVIGTINMRGEIIPIIDLRKFFELQEIPPTPNTRIVVFRQNQINLGLIVDSISDIVELPARLIEPPLATLERIKSEYLEGEAIWDNKLLVLLNLENIVHSITALSE